ncbi:MAG: translation initiation factor IF-2 subunit gamma [Candidatus Pacearchaeota archaeon]
MITKQPALNIGMVGHIDHGKTTLLYRLSGKWSDTHSEELKRGITIKLGYADVFINKCPKCGKFTREKECTCGGKPEPFEYISFIDVPGHEMLMATMLSGAAIIDAALLVIAANEPCPRPQTKEHLIALQAKGISNIIIVQNKIDLVSKEQALRNYNEIKEFIKGTVAENAPIIPCSAQQSINIDAIFEAITKIPIPSRDKNSEAIFFVARSFDINKPGTSPEQLKGGVLGGTLKQGILRVGDEIEIKPGMSIKKHEKTEYIPLKTKILGLQVGNTKLEVAEPSGSLAIQTELDPLLTKSDNLSGCVVGKVGKLQDASYNLKLRINLFKEVLGTEKKQEVVAIKVNEPLLLSVNTAVTLGNVTKIKGDEVECSLKIPVVALKGSKTGIARNYMGHWRLIGYGEII